jgi:hypothetical protein
MKKVLTIIAGLVLVCVTVFGGISLFGNNDPGRGILAQEDMFIDAEVVDFDAISQLSTVEVNPPVLPVGGTALVTVTVRGTGGVVRPNETVQLAATGLSGFVLTQPTDPTDANGQAFGTISSPVAGLIKVTAVVTTYAFDVPIDDFDTVLFEPVSVPVMQAEPQFTQGNTNTVSWTGNPLIDEFQVIVARDVGFTDGVIQSPWLSVNEYNFSNLLDGQIYYYRVRARNKYGVVSDWSNVVYSIQDASPPWSSVEDVEIQNDGFKVEINANDAISGVDFVRIFAKVNGKEWQEVKIISGSSTVISIDEIAGSNLLDRSGTFCFYSQAVDNVGNEEVYAPGESGDFCIEVTEPFEPPEEVIVEETRSFIEQLWEDMTSFIWQYQEEDGLIYPVLLAIPVGAFVAIVLLAFGSLQAFPLMIYLFLYDLLSLLGLTGKRERWGIVYDSVTKESLSRVVVRLFTEQTLVRTVVTDINGVFSFEPKAGRYTLTAAKQGYIFPSKIVVSLVDGIRKNIYRGGEYTIKSAGHEVEVNIPLDRIKMVFSRRIWSTLVSVLRTLFAILVPVILLIGAISALVCYVTLGEIVYLIIVGINSFLLMLHLSLQIRIRPRRGTVVDENGKPVGGVRIGLYDRVYGRLIDERVTDEKGKYGFIVDGGEYYLRPQTKDYVVAKKGFADGYPVGKKTDGDIIIVEKIVLRSVGGASQNLSGSKPVDAQLTSQ